MFSESKAIACDLGIVLACNYNDRTNCCGQVDVITLTTWCNQLQLHQLVTQLLANTNYICIHNNYGDSRSEYSYMDFRKEIDLRVERQLK